MGKRKSMELDLDGPGGDDSKQARDLRTVFARGVSFALSEADLEAAFTDIGPVRKCFLVRSKGEEKHRGYGFVQFALPEDAERAVQALNGRELGGRKLQLEIATKKAPLDQRYPKKPKVAPTEDNGTEAAEEGQEPAAAPVRIEKKAVPAPTPAPTTAPAARVHPRERGEGAADTQLKARTVAVGRLPRDKGALAAALRMIKSIGPVESFLDPAPQEECARHKLPADGCTGHTVFAVYKHGKDAVNAVKKLHGHVISSKDEQEAATLWARQLGGEGSHVKRWRLIVRNLPFSVTEADLKAAFNPAGFVWEASLPRKPDGKMRGFGFVAFTTKADAEHGISLLNGSSLKGRPIAVDWAVSKAEYADGKRAQEDGEGKAEQEGKEEKDGAEDEEEESEEEIDSEEDDDEDGLGSDEDEGDDDESEGEDDSEEDGDDEEGEEEAVPESEIKKELSLMQRIAGQLIQQEQQEEGGEKDRKEKSKGKGREGGEREASEAQPQDYEGRRSNPSDPSSSSLGDRKKPSGDGALPSTVFVRNLPLDVTQIALKMRLEVFGKVKSCRLVTDKTTGRCKGTAFVDFESHEGAARAAEASARAKKAQGPAIVVAGSEIWVDVALSKDGARSLAEEKAEGRKREKDRRNVYLAEEGRIVQGTPAWEQMSEGDRAKRERAFKDKKAKLASPNFIVSRTRLSIRNIPKAWSEDRLKACCVEAVLRRAVKAKPRVQQVKILREEEGGKGGEGKSKGLGFIEFDDHEHALCCLRELNNHPSVFNSRDRRPIVEFAMENVKIIKKREHLQNLAKERAQKEKKGKREGGDDEGKPKKLSRIQRRQERKKREREAAAAAAAAAGEGKDGEAVAGKKPNELGPAATGGKMGKKGLASSKQTARVLEEVSKEARTKAQTAKRERAERESAREDRDSKRRRLEESELDRIVAGAGLEDATGPNQGLSRKGNKKGKAKRQQEEDRLDSLVNDYVKKSFGDDRPARGAKGKKGQPAVVNVGKAGARNQKDAAAVSGSAAAATAAAAAAFAGGGIKRWFE